MTKAKRKFDENYKLHICELIRKQGLTITQVCTDDNLGQSSIHRWLNQYDAEVQGKSGTGLANIEQQLANGIEQTSQIIKDSLNTRANTTATAIEQSDKKIIQSLQNNSQQIDKQLEQYQALMQSKLSRLKQLSEDIQTVENQAHNQAIKKKLTLWNIGLISTLVILLMAIIFFTS